MEIIRRYASAEEAVNIKNIIQDLLATELDNILNSQSKDNSSTENNNLGSDCAWISPYIKVSTYLTKNLFSS